MSDDDATMPPDWLERFLRRFTELGPQLGEVGGEIVPVWGAPRPDWLTKGMLPLLSAWSGINPQAGSRQKSLLEGNCCYRREALVQSGGFSRRLGRKGDHLISSEHMVDLVMRMKGWKLFFDPAIVIYHTIHADRLTPQWMRRRFFWQGVSD